MGSVLPPSGIRVQGSKRVLVVDDSADSAELLGLMLERAGHQTSIVGSASAALDVAPNFRPQIALIDISLPDMDGCELVAFLRARPELEGCRFLATTGFSGHEAVARSLAAGFAEHLTKPLDLKTVLAAVAGAELCEHIAR